MTRVATGGLSTSNSFITFPNTAFAAVAVAGASLSDKQTLSVTPYVSLTYNNGWIGTSSNNTVTQVPLMYGSVVYGVASDLGTAGTDGFYPRVNYIGTDITPGTGYLSLPNRTLGPVAVGGDDFIPVDVTATTGPYTYLYYGNANWSTRVANTFITLGYNRDTGYEEFYASPPYTINYDGLTNNPSAQANDVFNAMTIGKMVPSPYTNELYIVDGGTRGPYTTGSVPLAYLTMPVSTSMFVYKGVSSNNIGSPTWLRQVSQSPNQIQIVPANSAVTANQFTTFQNSSPGGLWYATVGWDSVIATEYNPSGPSLWFTFIPKLPVNQTTTNTAPIGIAEYNFSNNTLKPMTAITVQTNNMYTLQMASGVYNSGRRESWALMRPSDNMGNPVANAAPTYATRKSRGSAGSYGTWSLTLSLPTLTSVTDHYWKKLVTVEPVAGFTPSEANTIMVMSASKNASSNSTMFARLENTSWAIWNTLTIPAANTTDWVDICYHAPTDEFVAIGASSPDIWVCKANATASWVRVTNMLPVNTASQISTSKWKEIYSVVTRPSDGFIDSSNTANVSSSSIGANSVQSCLIVVPVGSDGYVVLPNTSTAWTKAFVTAPPANAGVYNSNTHASFPGVGYFELVTSGPNVSALTYNMTNKAGIAYTENPITGLWRNQLMPQTFYGMTERIYGWGGYVNVASGSTGYQTSIGSIASCRTPQSVGFASTTVPQPNLDTSDTTVTHLIPSSNTNFTVVNYYCEALRANQTDKKNQLSIGSLGNNLTGAPGFTKPVTSAGWFMTVDKASGYIWWWGANYNANGVIPYRNSSLAYVDTGYTTVPFAGAAAHADATVFQAVVLRTNGRVYTIGGVPTTYDTHTINTANLYADTWYGITCADGIYTAVGATYTAISSDGLTWEITAHGQTWSNTSAISVQSAGPIAVVTYPSAGIAPSHTIVPTSRQMAYGPINSTTGWWSTTFGSYLGFNPDTEFVTNAEFDQYYQEATTGFARLWSWGFNLYGGLGDNTTAAKSSPVQTVAGGNNWKTVAVGNAGVAAAIKTDGTLWTWGLNGLGRLGDGTTVAKSSPVQTIAGGTNWKQVAIGGGQMAAVKTDGTLWTWGDNGQGLLGDNTTLNKSSPVQTVAGGTNWKQVSVSSDNAAAVKTDGTLWTWGWNGCGNLGDGTSVSKSSPVQTITGGTNWKQVSVGFDVIAAVKSDGTLWNWGYNGFGALGDNTTANRNSPVQTVAGGTNWKQVSCGNGVTAAIKMDGTLWLWGWNGNGQLGDGTVVNKSSPVQTIAGGTNWKQVAAGDAVTAAVKTDGTLWVWGSGVNGQLGDNTNSGSKSSPVQTIAGGTSWKFVAATGYSVAAIEYV